VLLTEQHRMSECLGAIPSCISYKGQLLMLSMLLSWLQVLALMDMDLGGDEKGTRCKATAALTSVF